MPALRLPPPLATAVGVVLLDYGLYVWHVLTHRVGWLWRFHRAHHADLDLDTSTAIRFHAGELAASVPWRMAQVVVIGVDVQGYRLWQRLTLLSIVFHHANLRLPFALERLLSCFFVTPRMHGTHHSCRVEERECNWSSGLSLWDRLHGTYRFGPSVPGSAIGDPVLRRRSEVRLGRILRLPWDAPDPSWQ